MTDEHADDADGVDLDAELARRLALLTAPDYDEPAREAFTRGDFVAIAAFVLLSCAGGWLILP